MELSAEDRDNLDRLERKFQMVRDRVNAVVDGYATGLFVHGEGGVGKSFTVLRELDWLKADYIAFNSRMTGRGLFEALKRFPSSIHVLEDMEGLFREKDAQGVLRSALWAQRPPDSTGPFERLVTWTTWRMEHSFVFTGGVIMIGNRPLPDLPELQAVKTRIPCLHLEVTAYELRAKMREISLNGYQRDGKQMEPAECWDVCQHVIDQSMAMRRPFDMRLLINSFADYLQWQEGDAGCHWMDLVAARIRERPTEFQKSVNIGRRAETKEGELRIVEEIVAASPERQERILAWKQRTGKSQAAFYRRLAELATRK